MFKDVKEITEEIKRNDNLVAHPEGGFYIRIDESPKMVPVSERYSGELIRREFTKINFLLVKNDYSAWHRLKSNEIWRFKEGTSITLYIISKTSPHDILEIKIGDPAKESDAIQEYEIEYDQWFAAKVNDGHSYCYVECEVRPGFLFKDYQLGKKEDLLEQFPQHSVLINLLAVNNIDEIIIPKESHKKANLPISN